MFLHRFREFLLTKLKEIFPEEDTEGTHVIPAIDFRAQVPESI